MSNTLADNIVTCHRCPLRAGAAVCPLGGRPLLAHAQAGDCPQGFHAGIPLPAKASPPPAPPVASDLLERRGRALWAELHARAAASTDLSGEPAYLAAFALRVPCGECRDHWTALVAANPVDLSSPDAYFLWTVARHNDVNRRLGKPEWHGRPMPGKDGA